MRNKAINIIRRAEMGEAPVWPAEAMKGVGVYSNDVSAKRGINYCQIMENDLSQLQKWFAAQRAMDAIRSRLAFLAEQERLRENGLDVNDAFKNLWPELHAQLAAGGLLVRNWLKETGDEGILGESP